MNRSVGIFKVKTSNQKLLLSPYKTSIKLKQ